MTSMEIIFSVYCPNCNTQTRISTRNKERLKEMKVDCSKCNGQDYAIHGIIKEENFEDWFSFNDGREQGKIQVSTNAGSQKERKEFEKQFKTKTKENSKQ